MDQELIAFLEARFRETAQQIAASHEETTRQIARLREETTHQVAKLREDTTHQIATFHEETTWRFEQVDSRFEKLEEATRHTLILVEGLRHELHLVAESVVGTNERLERYHREGTLTFDQVRGWIEPYFRNLTSRVSALEGQANLRHENVMDAIRELLGRPPIQSAL